MVKKYVKAVLFYLYPILTCLIDFKKRKKRFNNCKYKFEVQGQIQYNPKTTCGFAPFLFLTALMI